MDKNAIKKYAVWARRELIERLSQKALQYGISESEIIDVKADNINGHLLSATEKKQRQSLVEKINKKGFQEVIEDVAYTWFNRFIALRFMEVNGYLPSRVRVFTNDSNEFKPQIIEEAIHLNLEGLDKEKVFAFKEANQTEALYKYLLITQCNALNSILPGMFQKISDYSELLFPDNILRAGSVIEQMVSSIPEEDWMDAVQIIGWLYQYYNAEKKEDVFAALKKNVKITKENIPAATQIFTPDWIVRYMVENSLGRLWVEGHPNEEMKSTWKYYLEEAEQESDVEDQLSKIRIEYSKLTPEEIKVIDPCCGSGHILVYMFDVLMQIYLSYGYTSREAVASIVKNNIYGLDLDARAAQLSYFAIMMKARQYDRRFFSHIEQPNVYPIVESNDIDPYLIDCFCDNDKFLKHTINTICDEMYDAKEYGSIINIDNQNWEKIYNRFIEIQHTDSLLKDLIQDTLWKLVKVAEILSIKYDCSITNPPYMSSSGMSEKLSLYVKRNYPYSKFDLFAVFIEKIIHLTKKNRYLSMITMQSWLSLASYENLRNEVLNINIINMAHLGSKAFEDVSGEKVQTVSFVLHNTNIRNRYGNYVRLVDGTTAKSKEDLYLAGNNNHVAKQDSFYRIPGIPISAYIAGDILASIYEKCNTIGEIGEVKIGMGTGNNELFLKAWWEINKNKICFSLSDVSQITDSGKKYFPYSKGGDRKRWYGNHEDVVWYDKTGQELMNNTSGHRENGGYKYYFHKGITWSYSTMSSFSSRSMPNGFVFDVNGSSLFIDENKYNYVLAFLQSCVGRFIIDSTKSAFSIQAGTIRNLPIKFDNKNKEIDYLVDDCISIAKMDWDSFETSWDFEVDPLVRYARILHDAESIRSEMNYYLGCQIKVNSPMELCFLLQKGKCNKNFDRIKNNEEKINTYFINLYSLENEILPQVYDEDITIYRLFDDKKHIPESMLNSKYAITKNDVVKNFISFAVGCMFGRYSLDEMGVICTGTEWDNNRYVSYESDQDNIIPISDDEYFEDDIVSKFINYVNIVFGNESLEANLSFIANALEGKGNPREVIRKYFLTDFYKDHCKMYEKRPIYWLFDSGKKNGFKALVYMHRYQPDLIARIRTDYVHEQQGRYRTAIEDVELRLNSVNSTSEKVKLNKQLTKLKDQDAELRVYEEKIHHLADQMISIDLDDGVKHNYELFKDVLAKIK